MNLRDSLRPYHLGNDLGVGTASSIAFRLNPIHNKYTKQDLSLQTYARHSVGYDALALLTLLSAFSEVDNVKQPSRDK